MQALPQTTGDCLLYITLCRSRDVYFWFGPVTDEPRSSCLQVLGRFLLDGTRCGEGARCGSLQEGGYRAVWAARWCGGLSGLCLSEADAAFLQS